MASKRESSGTPNTSSDPYQPHETRRHKTMPARPIPLGRPRIPEVNTSAAVLTYDELRMALEREALERQHAIDHPHAAVEDVETAILPHRPTAEEIENLKQCWLSHPTWDIEFSVGFDLVFNELAAWHDEQIWRKAKALGCSHLMASILEELVRCWIGGVPPKSPFALRLLASYA